VHVKDERWLAAILSMQPPGSDEANVTPRPVPPARHWNEEHEKNGEPTTSAVRAPLGRLSQLVDERFGA
jgi:hypothetical protein